MRDSSLAARQDHSVPLVVLVTLSLALGLPLDAHGPPWGQPALGVWNLALLAWVSWRHPGHRLLLLTCFVLASLGELLLGNLWGLYDYRLGNLPLYIPPGHALVFAMSLELAPRAPRWLPRWTAAGVVAWTVLGVVTGPATASLLWAPVILGCLRWGGRPGLYAPMVWVALAIELYGTGLGAWAYRSELPGLGLSSPNPPVLAGAFYCLLDRLCLLLVGRSWEHPHACSPPADSAATPRP